MSRLIIIGAGCHGRVIADIAKATSNYDNICFLDDGISGICDGFEIIGKTSDFEKYVDDCDFCVGFGENKLRRMFCEDINAKGGRLKSFVHSSATVAESAKIGKGVVIVAGAVVNICANIGDGVIINTAASVDHDCSIGDYTHISVGAHVCGTVTVGECVDICAGATLIQDLTICSNAVIGAGAVVIKDITKEGTYIGVPACEKGELRKTL